MLYRSLMLAVIIHDKTHCAHSRSTYFQLKILPPGALSQVIDLPASLWTTTPLSSGNHGVLDSLASL